MANRLDLLVMDADHARGRALANFLKNQFEVTDATVVANKRELAEFYEKRWERYHQFDESVPVRLGIVFESFANNRFKKFVEHDLLGTPDWAYEQFATEYLIAVKENVPLYNWLEGRQPPRAVMLVVEKPGAALPSTWLAKAIEEKKWLAPRVLPQLDYATETPEEQTLLRQQICVLDPDEKREAAEKSLARIVGELWGCAASVSRIGQGRSGSTVLRVQLRPSASAPAAEPPSYVLKIAHTARQQQLMRREHDNLPNITLALTKKEYKRFIPVLHRRDGHSGLVQHDGLTALAYDFLEFGVDSFLDLERVYLSDPRAASQVVDAAFARLREAWHLNGRCREKHLWNFQDVTAQEHDAADRAYLFGFNANWKARILKSMARLDSFKRVYSDAAWSAACKSVKDWLTPDGGAGQRLVLTSCIHGDLNSNNILWWAKEKEAFFIDFATYAENGPAMSDLANLETEVVYALLDREHGSAHPAFDYTPARLETWIALQDHILCGDAGSTVNDDPGVQPALDLCRLIRQHSRDVYAEVMRKTNGGATDEQISDGFAREYHAASLYHTLRFVGYERDVSPFKQMLAVHGAAAIIEKWFPRKDSV